MRPTPQAVREAAQALKQAIDAHLFAVETRLGDSDVAVELAYRDIRAATEQYDKLLLGAYNEVTPFMFMDAEGEQGEFDELGLPKGGTIELPPVVSLCLRRDYAVVDPDAVVDNGRQAHQAAQQAGLPVYEQQPPQNLPEALYAMFQVAGVDGLDAASTQAGLASLGGAVWFLAGDDPQMVDVDTAFDSVDAERVIFRVHEVPGAQDVQPADQRDDQGVGGLPGLAERDGAASAEPSAPKPARTPWSFDTGSLPVVPSGDTGSHLSVPPGRSPEPQQQFDPLDTTQAFVWQDETSWTMPAHPEPPHTSHPDQRQDATMQWESGLFRDPDSAPDRLARLNDLDEQGRPARPRWDHDDPLADSPRRRKSDQE